MHVSPLSQRFRIWADNLTSLAEPEWPARHARRFFVAGCPLSTSLYLAAEPVRCTARTCYRLDANVQVRRAAAPGR